MLMPKAFCSLSIITIYMGGYNAAGGLISRDIAVMFIAFRNSYNEINRLKVVITYKIH